MSGLASLSSWYPSLVSGCHPFLQLVYTVFLSLIPSNAAALRCLHYFAAVLTTSVTNASPQTYENAVWALLGSGLSAMTLSEHYTSTTLDECEDNTKTRVRDLFMGN